MRTLTKNELLNLYLVIADLEQDKLENFYDDIICILALSCNSGRDFTFHSATGENISHAIAKFNESVSHDMIFSFEKDFLFSSYSY